MIGYGDLTTAFLALLSLMLYALARGAIALVWRCVIVGMLDTVNAVVQSMRVSVFTYPFGVQLRRSHSELPHSSRSAIASTRSSRAHASSRWW